MFVLRTAITTYIDPCGIKRAFVGDAEVADGVCEFAVGQQAFASFHDGHDYGHTQAHCRGSG